MSHQTEKSGRGLAFATILLFISLAILHFDITGQRTWPQLFGSRSNAVFDLWAFQHLLGGTILGSFYWHCPDFVLCRVHFRGLKSFSRTRKIIAIEFFALFWEALELATECGLLLGEEGMRWKSGYEHWGNRFVGDLLMVTAGSLLLGRRSKHAWWIAFIPAAIYWAVNITCPDSMYLQRWLQEQVRLL